jgi:hypothetical protein
MMLYYRFGEGEAQRNVAATHDPDALPLTLDDFDRI